MFTNHEITVFIFQIAPHTMQVNGVSHHGIVDQRDPEPLTVFQQTGAASIPLKAIITPHNIFWTAEALYKELWKEHLHFI